MLVGNLHGHLGAPVGHRHLQVPQPLPDSEVICKRLKALKLSGFRALPIAGVQGGDFVVLAGNGRRNTAVHPAAHQNHGSSFIGVLLHLMASHRQELGF